MNDSFNISVIIPAYNVELFIEKAIFSALNQREVTEVIVVDDGSTDGTLAIVLQFQQNEVRIKIYQHPNGINKGRSATRNLGIQKATANYIAFLDADDYFLPNRFTNDANLFLDILDCDGVYNAIGAHFYRDTSISEQEQLNLFTVTEKINSKALFETLLLGKKGHFSIDGLTVKRKVFDKVGLFNEKLIVAEDTDLLWKMAIKCRLEAGVIDKALAIRGVHETNVFNNLSLCKLYYVKMLQSVLIWSSKNHVDFAILDLILKQIWVIKQKEKNKLVIDINYWSILFLPYFRLLFSSLSIKYFPIIRYRQMLFPFLYQSRNK